MGRERERDQEKEHVGSRFGLKVLRWLKPGDLTLRLTVALALFLCE